MTTDPLTLPETATPRERVIRTLELFAEGGSVQDHMKACGVNSRTFYGIVYKDNELDALYKEMKRGRADMNIDECYKISMNQELDSKRARVQAEILMKLAAFYDRPQYGEKVDVTVDQRVSVSAALSAARARALKPVRDLAGVIDAEIVQPQQLTDQRPIDSKSVETVEAPRINPFDE